MTHVAGVFNHFLMALESSTDAIWARCRLPGSEPTSVRPGGTADGLIGPSIHA